MSFVCSACGQTHDSLPAMVTGAPDAWSRRGWRARLSEWLTDDFRQTPDGHRFVRARLQLPLIDGPQSTFEFGVWGSLSEANFKRYKSNFRGQDQSKLGPMFSYLSNELAAFPGSYSLKANLHPQDHRFRPLMELELTDHPLAIAQREGIAFAKALEIIHSEAAS